MFTKRITALMVLVAMLVAGAAFAGDYTIYGKMHASVNYLSNGDDGQLGLTSNTSRFGIRGSTPMYNNTDMIWQFENHLNIAQKDRTTLATRNSFIGMRGEWGTALFGIHDTPFLTIGRKATFFHDSIGDFRNTTMGWDQRLQDVAVYVSPDFDGFGFVAAYMFDQTAMAAPDTVESATAVSFSAQYQTEALYLAGAMEHWSKGVTGASASGGTEAQTGLRFVAKYDFGQFAMAGLFQNISNHMGYDGVSARTMGLEAKYKMTDDYCAKGSFYMADPNTDVDDNEFNQLALGVDRKTGKNSMVYLQYATVMNGDASAKGLCKTPNGFGGSVEPHDVGESPMGISVGWVTTWK